MKYRLIKEAALEALKEFDELNEDWEGRTSKERLHARHPFADWLGGSSTERGMEELLADKDKERYLRYHPLTSKLHVPEGQFAWKRWLATASTYELYSFLARTSHSFPTSDAVFVVRDELRRRAKNGDDVANRVLDRYEGNERNKGLNDGRVLSKLDTDFDTEENYTRTSPQSSWIPPEDFNHKHDKPVHTLRWE